MLQARRRSYNRQTDALLSEQTCESGGLCRCGVRDLDEGSRADVLAST